MIVDTLSSVDARALELLGSGVTVGQTAAAIGVSESRIAQLLSDDNFAAKLSEKRFTSLAKHNARDGVYDELEDSALKQLKGTLPLVQDPLKLARVIQVLNGAKRRGASSPDNILQKQTVIKLQLPIQIVNRFSTNSQNQVVTIDSDDGPKSMVTVQSGQMKKLVERNRRETEIENEATLILAKESNVHERSLRKFGFD